jgi:DNA-binding transcriptional ArsR family regulator
MADPVNLRKRGLDDVSSPQLFKALCDPNRVAILGHMSKRCVPMTVGQIAENLPVDISVVSRHLATLRKAGILIARKKGKEVLYSINSRNLVTTLRAIADAFEACCPEECLMDGDQNIEPDAFRTDRGMTNKNEKKEI